MKTLLAALALLAAGAAQAAGLADYRETLTLARDGNAAMTIAATLTDWPEATAELPLAFPTAADLHAEADGAAVPAERVRHGELSLLALRLPRTPTGPVHLNIGFTAPKFLDWAKARSPRGVSTIGYAFLNTTPLRIAGFAARIVLPEGHAMNGVTRSIPAPTGEEVVPPYDFATESGRLVVNLHAPALAPGQSAAISFGVCDARRSPWLALILGLGVLVGGLAVKLRAPPTARAIG